MRLIRVLTSEWSRLILFRREKMKTQAIAMILIILVISQTLSAPQGFRRFVGGFSRSHESNANRSSLRGRFAGKSVGFGRRFSRPFYTHMDKLEKDSDSDSDSDSDLEEDSEEPSALTWTN